MSASTGHTSRLHTAQRPMGSRTFTPNRAATCGSASTSTLRNAISCLYLSLSWSTSGLMRLLQLAERQPTATATARNPSMHQRQEAECREGERYQGPHHPAKKSSSTNVLEGESDEEEEGSLGL